MASFPFSLLALLAALTLFRPATAPFLPLDELERAFLATEDSAHLVTFPHTDSSSLYPGEQVLGRDGTLSDVVLQRFSHHDHQSPAAQETPIQRPDTELLNSYEVHSSSPSTSLWFKELSLQERTDEINLLKTHFYFSAGARARGVMTRTWPYRELLPQVELLQNLEALRRLEPRQGAWPYTIEDKHYLLYKATATPPAFEQLSDFQTPSKTRVYINVLRQVGERDAQLYQFIGTFRGPDRAKVTQYRRKALESSAVRIQSIGLVGASRSTVHVGFGQWFAWQRAVEQ
ncbi:uncharacterized protein SRS1_13494 [Sporisorium reilianum f. sp. reilianum]|uniref:Effector family protein Eff1 n=1 Tax=Sporisorium reilianum f. sp. reilianum TaxID=72559 RepID=A0A2N8UNH2_9BASI|nr:uncharacterized protein SRS1_13494 [Sporisorium reilianum f. sp. reilianum]